MLLRLHNMRFWLLATGLSASLATAQEIPTPCAFLPEQGIIATRTGPDVTLPPQRNGSQWVCQAGFRLLLGPPRCVGPSAIPVMGNPQALCYANIPFSLRRYGTLTRFSRPIAAVCPETQQAGLLLSGASIGHTDVAISVLTSTDTPAPGISVVAHRASGPQVPAHEDPVLNNCHAYACVRLTLSIGRTAPDAAKIRFALPGGRHVDHPIATAPKCRPVRRANNCPGPGPGSTAPGTAYACSPI